MSALGHHYHGGSESGSTRQVASGLFGGDKSSRGVSFSKENVGLDIRIDSPPVGLSREAFMKDKNSKS